MHSRRWDIVDREIVSACLLVMAWFWANSDSVRSLISAYKQASGLNLVLMAVAVIVLLVQGLRLREEEVWTSLKWRSLPLGLMLGGMVGAIALRSFIDIEQLSLLLFLLGTYGLVGLFLSPSLWRKGLPLGAILACIIPFSAQLGMGLGIPARMLTAYAVEQILSTWHIAAISSYDIIVLENGIAQVDIPCSGLKSLWTGTIFLLAATAIERRIISFRWLLVCSLNICLLVLVNIIRVLLLVLIIQVWKQPQFAQILHLPLGLVGLVCACSLTWIALQWVPKFAQKQIKTRPSNLVTSPISNTQFSVLLTVILALGLIAQFQTPEQLRMSQETPLQLPTSIVSKSIPLTTAEQGFFQNYPELVPHKLRFSSGELSGSMLVVANTTWRTYHPPELCLMGNGLTVDKIERHWLNPTLLTRWLFLQKGQLSATYWFQSSQQTTDDFLTRFWSDLSHHQKNWTMVSILFNSPRSPDSLPVRQFTGEIQEAIAKQLSTDVLQKS